MKISDFASKDFEFGGEIQLSEWVINGDHHPKVKTYHNHKTKVSYQVAEKHKKFRKTEAAKDFESVQQYGKWEELRDV